MPINPYGRTKLFIEYMIKDKDSKIDLLRYCNPVASQFSGKIGEDLFSKPTNLFPIIQNLVRDNLKEMKIFWKDYPKKDGTCIRDYIHANDIDQGHIVVLNAFEKENEKLFNENTIIYNMGANKVYSLKEVLEIYEKANKIKLK